MARSPIVVDTLPTPLGPFSYGVQSNGFVYVSGALGVGEDWKVVAPNDVKAQARKALDIIKAVLAAAGLPLSNVVKMTVHLTSSGDYRAFNEVRRAFFTEPYPASTVVVVKELVVQDAVVEIDVVADAEPAVGTTRAR